MGEEVKKILNKTMLGGLSEVSFPVHEKPYSSLTYFQQNSELSVDVGISLIRSVLPKDKQVVI